MPSLGVIEGFYGKPWTWETRRETISFLAPWGYGFYIYAPKGDPFLRRRWQEPHPAEVADEIGRLASHCGKSGVHFGAGLSPYEIFNDFNDATRTALASKLSFLDDVGTRYLAILYDDMRGDIPDLARKQLEITHWAAERTKAERIIVCPTYYSDDPVLDNVFGARAADYLEDLGKGLDPAIDIFWTGEEVISRQFSPGHLERVGSVLRRRPFIWDNYPVNDGQRLSQYLHLRGFTGRPAALADLVAGHAINPALQPVLSRIPAITLSDSYRLGDSYQYGESFRRACDLVLGGAVGRLVYEDLLTLQDIGLDRLGTKETRLRERYGAVDNDGAREIVAWLDGAYRITDEIVQTQ